MDSREGGSFMAMSDEIREQRKLLKGKGIKAHIAWFWEYERWPTIIVLAVVGIVVSLIYHYATNKPYAFGILFMNAYVQEDNSEELGADFMEYAGIDSSTNTVLVDLNESATPGGNYSSEYEMYAIQKIMVEIAANQLDAMMADAWYFDNYAYQGSFADLRDVLDEETLEKYKDKIYYIDRAEQERRDAEDALSEVSEELEADADDAEAVTEEAMASELLEGFTLPDPSAMEDPIPVGIWCNEAAYIKDNGYYDSTACILGAVTSGDHLQSFQQFLEYLFEK